MPVIGPPEQQARPFCGSVRFLFMSPTQLETFMLTGSQWAKLDPRNRKQSYNGSCNENKD
jgi:hypothetical protein